MKTVYDIACYEVLQILKDRLLTLIVFATPLAYAILFGAVYYAAVLNQIPLAIVDEDQTALSREIRQSFANSPSFRVIDGINSYADLEINLRSGQVRAGIMIPAGLARDVSIGQPVQILTVYDASNLIWGYNSRRKMLEIIREINTRLVSARLATTGMPQKDILEVVNAVECNFTVWYNPSYNYMKFLLLGLMMMIIHQIGLLSVGLTVTREKEHHTWTHFLTSPLPGWKIALGKCLPYLIANFFHYAVLLWICARVLPIGIQGSAAILFVLGLVYVVTITFTGFILSLYFTSSLQLTRFLMLLSVPIFLISGATWPLSHMPRAVQMMARCLPFTWMAEVFRNVTVKGLAWPSVMVPMLVLTGMAGLTVVGALGFKKRHCA